MNIHFFDENLFDELMDSAISKIRFGSHIYGLNTTKSDSDILVIYAEGKVNSSSLLQTHNILQFKKDNVDYVFATIQQFVNNILNGDATINYEILYSEDLRNDKNLSFLYENIEMFNNYNIVKCYLGMGSRDLKHLKRKGQFTGKKASHVIRGILSAQSIVDGVDMETVWKNNRDLLLSIKNKDVLDEELSILLSKYESIMKDLRLSLNKKLDARIIDKIISVENAYILDKWIFEFVQKDFYVQKQKKFLDFNNLFYKAEYALNDDEKFNYNKKVNNSKS